MMSASTPVVLPAGKPSGVAADPPAEAGGLAAGFASLLGLEAGDGGTGGPVEELAPQALALLLESMFGARAGLDAVASAPAGCKPAPALRSAGATAPGGLRPTEESAAFQPGSGCDAAMALEAVLRDILLPDPPRAPGASAPAAATTPGQKSPQEAPGGMPAILDLPPPRPAPDVTHRHAAAVQTPVGTHGWPDDLAGRIAWVARENLQSASIRLSPEHLGPLDVQISVRDGDAVVSFAASHAETRAALEQSLPRLRELLAAQGIALAHADVSEHAARHGQEAAPHPLRGNVEEREAAPESPVRLSSRLVDLYA